MTPSTSPPGCSSAAEPGEVARRRAHAGRDAAASVDYDGPRRDRRQGQERARRRLGRARDFAARPARRGVEGLSAPIIGRDEELAVLAALAARVVRERAPQLVTLFGQAGVGKSRLLAEFVDRLPDARLLKGRCLPYGDGITYWPLAEVAKEHAGILDTDPAGRPREAADARRAGGHRRTRPTASSRPPPGRSG